MRALSRIPASAILVTALLSGCVTQAFDSGAYHQNGLAALDSASSAVGAASAAVDARLADNATRAYADVVVTESEKAIAPIEASFGGVDPPDPAEDQLRDQVLEAVGAAGDALSQARIAVRRDDDRAIHAASEDLQEAKRALNALRESLGEAG